jgi:ATPase inhibitor subunit zeta
MTTVPQAPFRMTIPDDWKKAIRSNKLLGMWAAEKLGITGRDAEAYSDALLHDEPKATLSYACSPHHVHTALFPFIVQLERTVGFSRTDSWQGRLNQLESLLGQIVTG